VANEIHSKKNSDGTTSFRMWSTYSDTYITGEMSEVEVRQWTREETVAIALRNHEAEIDLRIERTTKTGTSSVTNPRESLKEWEMKAS
jgi:hypothetical protein